MFQTIRFIVVQNGSRCINTLYLCSSQTMGEITQLMSSEGPFAHRNTEITSPQQKNSSSRKVNIFRESTCTNKF